MRTPPPTHRTPTRRFVLRPISLAVCLLGAAPASFGLPQDGVPSFGQTTVRQTAPNQLDITQGTQRAGIDWRSFSIGANERVVVTQPGRDSVLLNRVLGNDPSQIFGSLQSNGSVWLINPRGIVFGANSRVDVGGLLASTLSITNEDIASGRLVLGRGAGTAGELVNEGQITAPGGSVVLVAPRLTHSGRIDARRVGLAAATEVTVDVEGDGLIFFNARNDGSLATRLSLLGSIFADGGLAEVRAAARAGFADTVLNLDGIVQARSIGQRHGRIVIDGGSDGVTLIGGRVDATGGAAGEQGGEITVLGQKIGVASSATLDASGAAGGGTLLVGGDFQGKNAALHNAEMVSVLSGARLDVSATQLGDGGKLIVWSDQVTRFAGAADARGGAHGGDGGFVEVSGKQHLDFTGSSDRSAPQGRAGMLLLDPKSLLIQDSGADINGAAGGPSVDIVDGDLTGAGVFRFNDFNAANPSIITKAGIAALTGGAGGAVTLQAEDSITVAAGAALTRTGALTLQAGANIVINANITSTGDLNLLANNSGGAQTGSGRVELASGVTLNSSGTVTISNDGGGATGVHQIGGNITAASLAFVGGVNLTGNSTWTLGGSSSISSVITGGAGAGLEKAGGGTMVLSGTNTYAGTTTISGGTLSVGAGSTTGTLGAGAVTNNAILAFNRSDDLTVANAIGGTGNLTQAGAGKLTLTGTNTYDGSTSITAGVLEIGAGGTTGTLGDGAVTIGTGTTLRINRSNTLTIANAIDGDGGLVQAGSGVADLTAANTYLGGSSVTAGTLRLRNNSTTAAAGAGAIALAAGTTLDIAGGASVANDVTLAGSASITSSNGGGTLAAGTALSAPAASTLTLGSVGGTLTIARSIGEAAAAATVSISGGTVALSAANTYSGATNVTAGTLRLSGAGTAGDGSNAVALAAGTTLDIGNAVSVANDVTLAGNASITSSSGGGTLAAGTALSAPAASTLTLSGGSGSLTVVRDIDQAGATAAVAVTGGTVILSSAGSDYAGGTAVSGGAALRVSGSGVAGLGAITLASGATLDLVNAIVANAITSNGGAISNSSGTATLSAANALTLGDATTITLSGAGGGLTVARAIDDGAGTGAVTVAGGSVTFAADNSYGGITTLSGGTLNIGAGGTTGTLGAGAVTNNAILAFNRSDDFTVANAIGGTGNLTQAGAGKLTLTGTNTYDGSTSITAGVLEIGDGGTTGTLGDGAVTIGTGTTLRINRSNTLTIANAIDGDGGLVQAGSGVADLTAANTYLGGSSVTAGTLRLRNNSTTAAAGAGAIALAAGTTLDIAGGASVANDVTLAGNASVTSSVGGGTLAAGTALSAPAASTLTLGSVGGTLTIARSIGEAAAAATVSISGGTVALSAANTYSGATNVTAGTLRLSGAGTAGDGSNAVALAAGTTLDIGNAVSVANDVTLAGNASITSSSGGGTLAAGTALSAPAASTLTLSGGSGSLTVVRDIDQAGATAAVAVTGGTVILSSAGSDYAGGTAVSGGAALRVSGSGVAGLGAITLASGATLDLVNAIVANAITSNGGAISNSSGTATLSAANALTLGDATTTTLSGAGGGLTVARAIDDGAGTGAVTVAGGSVTFAADNSYGGITTLSGGTLNIGAGGTTGTLGAGAVTNNAILAFNRSDDFTVANAIGGTGNLTQAGAGKLTLTGTNTYDGSTSITAGVLEIGDGGTTGTLGDGAVTIGTGTTLRINRSNTLTIANAIDGDGGLVQAGNGVADLTAANTYLGGSSVTAGTLRLRNNSTTAAAGAGAIALAAGTTLDIAGGASVANDVTLAGSASITSSNGGGTLAAGTALSAPAASTLTLSGGSGSLAVVRDIDQGGATAAVAVNGGTVILSSAGSDYAGGTAVSGGATLRVSGSGVAGLGAITLASGAALDLVNAIVANAITSNGGAISNSSGTATLSAANALTLGDATTTTLSGAGGGLAVARVIADGAGTAAVTVSGGSVTFSADNSYGGITTLSAGTLNIGAGGTTGTLGAGAVTNNATLAFNRSNDLTLANAIGGTGNLTQAGAGKLTLTGTNTYDGSTSITAGVLEIGDGGTTGTLGDNAVSVSTGTTLRINRSDTLTIANAIGGNGGLVQAGSGTTELTAVNTYLGDTSVDAGILRLLGAGTAGASSGTIALGSRTLDIAGGASVANEVTIANGGTITNSSGIGTLAAGPALVLPAASSITLSSSGTELRVQRVIDASAGGSGVVFGGGTVTLGSGSSYDGAVSVAGGATLRLAGSATLGAAAIDLASGGTLDIVDGAAVGVAVASSGGSITNTSGSGTLNGALTLLADSAVASTATGLTLAGSIDGTFGLNKSGAGSVTLSATNTYAGLTTINAGTLNIGGGGNTGTLGSGAVVNNATLRFNRGNDLTLANAIGGTGNVIKVGAGTLTLSGANSYSGATAVDFGTLVAGNALALGTAAGGTTVASGATLELNGVNIGTEALNLTGIGLAGVGALVGTGTAVAGGAVTLAGNASIGGSGNLNLSGVVGESGGARSLTKVGNGTLTLSGTNTYTGATAVDAGTLVATNALALGTAADGTNVASGATLQLNAVDIGAEALSLAGSGVGGVGALVAIGNVAAGGSVTLAGNSTVGGTGTLALGGAIGESGGARALTKTGSGTLTLSGANSYSGATAVDFGTLVADNALALGTAAGGTTVASGATLELNGVNIGTEALNLTGAGLAGVGALVGTGTAVAGGAVTLAGSTSIGGGGNLNLGGAIGGASALMKIGSGTLTLSGANTYTGATAVNTGTLVAANALALGGTAQGTTVSSGATLVIDNASIGNEALSLAGTGAAGGGALVGTNNASTGGAVTLTADTAIGGTGTLTLGGSIGESGGASSLTKIGSGSLSLAGANSYTGSTAVNVGTLVASNALALGTTAAGTTVASGATLNVNNVDIGSEALQLAGSGAGGAGALAGSGAGAAAGGAITLATDAAIGSTGALTLGGAIGESGGARALNKVGSGTLTLAGNNTYTGGTNLAAGTLRAQGGAAIPDASALTLTAGANFTLLNSETIGSLAASGASTAVVALGTNTLTTGGNGNSTSFDGVISGGAASQLVKTGSGSFTLAGANTYTGTTTVNAGTLALGASNSLADTSAIVINGATASFDIGTSNDTVAALLLQGGGTIAGSSGVLSSSSAFELQSGSVSGRLGGSAGVNKTTTGTVTFSGANTYTGTTTVTDGTLALGASNSLDDASALVVNGATATLDIGSRSDTVASLLLQGGGTVTGSTGVLASTSAFDLQSGTVSAILGGSAGLNKTTAGSVTLSAANSFTGATTVSAGNLVLGAAERLANTSTLVVSGGSFDLGGFAETVAGVQQTGGSIVNGTLISSSAFDMQAGSASAVLAGSAGLNKTGTGTFTLAGANTYTGATTVSSGTLLLGAAARLADASTLAVSGGVFDLGGFAETVAAVLQTGGSITNGVLGSTSGFDLQAGSNSAALVSSTGLNKTGAGTITLTGSYSGAITVSGGTLALGADNVIADGSSVTVNGATATFDIGTHSDTVASVSLLSGSIAGTSGVLTSVAAFDLQNGTVNAILGGSAGLNKTGAGSVTLNAANTSTGATTISAGTLLLGAAERLANTGTLVVAGGVFNLGGFAETVAGVQQTGGSIVNGTLSSSSAFDMQAGSASATLAGAVGLNKTTAGTFTISGANTYTGVTTVSAGTLALGASNSLADSGALVVNGAAATFDVGSHNDTVATVSLQGGGSLTGSTGVLGSTAAFDLQSGSVGAILGGSAGLNKTTAGNVTLSGANSYTGTTNVSAGNLVLASAERLADTSTMTVAPGATLTLNGGETVAALTLAGTLGGSGTLTAASYGLDSGTVNGTARLGGGALTSTGSSLLTGIADAGTVNVAGGTLTLAAADRLADNAVVTVASGARLALNGNDTVGSLLLSGALDGSSTLTAATYTLSGGTVNANLGGGALLSSGNSVLNGSSAAASVGIDGGTLTLGAADRLADSSAVTVASGARLQMTGDDTVDSLLLRGLLAGASTLKARSITLDGGTANANLDTPSLVSLGSSTLAGTAAAGTVDIQAGTLTLAAADRLANGAAVSVANGATLTLGGNDTVTTLLLQGTLSGSGRLSATTTTLAGGTALADLGNGALVSTGASTLAGGSLADTVLVSSGTLALASAGRLQAAPALSVNTGATLALGGNETVGSLANGLAGGGSVNLGAATLATGSSGADTSFAGAITGTGGLTKQGSGNFSLAGANTYSGLTRIDTGTLTIGDGGSGGSISGSTIVVDGVLRSARADSVSFGQAISGSGAFEQGGSGSVTLQGGNKTYSGETRVLSGALATLGSEQLPDASGLRVATGATLALGGDETLRSVDALGTVTLGGNLTTTGAMALTGAVSVGSGLSVTLKGQQIDAVNTGNDWGSGRLSIDAGGTVALDSGSSAGQRRDLVLGSVNAAAGGTVSAGIIGLQGDVAVSGGTLSLVSSAPALPTTPDAALLGKISPAQRQIAFAGDVVTQATGTRIDVAETAGLQVIAENGGSVQLLGRDVGNDPTLAPLNSFRGSLEVRSGGAFSAWAGNLVPYDSHVQIGGTTVRVGGAGIEADIVAIRADRLSTAPGAVITARMPYDNLAGTTNALPALTLELTDAAFLTSFPFGQNGGNEIAINVGSRAWGNRTSPLDSGYITVLPRNGARGATAVVLSGPPVGGYNFYFDGAGVQTEIPVFYNGVLPVTPQVSGSISATVAVSEGARKERFDEAVRTENVAVRLRSGVIAEVGPGRPATVGTEGARTPAGCTPAAGTLACEAP